MALSNLFICFLLFLPAPQNNYVLTAKGKINGIYYKAVLNQDQSISIKANRKLVQQISNKDISLSGSIASLTFLDFDKDGYQDLLIRYFSNVPGMCDLFIYDKTNKHFIKINEFYKYPAAIKIPRQAVYYSYHRSGCADEDWDSDLFKIDNYKTITIGTISGRDCGDDETGVFIYGYNRLGKRLVNKMPIDEINNYYDTKWGFIAYYWKHNYAKFN
jgi:hypothetical protein